MVNCFDTYLFLYLIIFTKKLLTNDFDSSLFPIIYLAISPQALLSIKLHLFFFLLCTENDIDYIHNPVGTYLLKVNSRTREQGLKYVQS